MRVVSVWNFTGFERISIVSPLHIIHISKKPLGAVRTRTEGTLACI